MILIGMLKAAFNFAVQKKLIKEIMKQEPDNHIVINGFHFISVTTTRGCKFSDEKRERAYEIIEAYKKGLPTNMGIKRIK